MSMAPQAILFDWDNTLVNTWPTITDALNHTLRAMDQPEWSPDQVRARVKQSMRDSFPVLFGDRWEEASEIYQARFRAIHLERLEPLPQAEAMLQAVRRHGAFMAIVSNKKGVNLRKEVEHLGWEHYFDAMVGANDAAADKPDPAPVKLALGPGGLDDGALLWFIGDTGIDLECAANVGAVPVLYGDVAVEGNRYDGHAFTHHARDHEALAALVDTAFNGVSGSAIARGVGSA